jgi:hypothetical protein
MAPLFMPPKTHFIKYWALEFIIMVNYTLTVEDQFALNNSMFVLDKQEDGDYEGTSQFLDVCMMLGLNPQPTVSLERQSLATLAADTANLLRNFAGFEGDSAAEWFDKVAENLKDPLKDFSHVDHALTLISVYLDYNCKPAVETMSSLEKWTNKEYKKFCKKLFSK